MTAPSPLHPFTLPLPCTQRQEASSDRERGAYHFKQGDYVDALHAFDECLKKSPDDLRAHLNRAATLTKLDMPRRAILAADRALQLTDGKEAKAWYRRAAAWLACGEFNEAIADCDAAKQTFLTAHGTLPAIDRGSDRVLSRSAHVPSSISR